MSPEERIAQLERQLSDLSFRLEITEDVQSRLGCLLFQQSPGLREAYRSSFNSPDSQQAQIPETKEIA